MKRPPVFIIIAFVIGLAAGFFARSAGLETLLRRNAHAAELAAIEELHQEDIAATLTQDPKGLLDIWTEDAVRFNPGNPPAVGKQAIQAENEKGHVKYPGFKVLSYAAKYKNIQIEDGMACEWGEHEAQLKFSPDAAPANWRMGAFHVLRRQSDGSWKFAVLIWEH